MPTRAAPSGSVAPKPRRHSSGTPSACCNDGGTTASSPSGSIGSTSAPSAVSSPATKRCIGPGSASLVSTSIEFISEQRLVQLFRVFVIAPRRGQLPLQRSERRIARRITAL